MMVSKSFYDFAWNPIVGCLRDCWYCYARCDIEKRGQVFHQVRFFRDRLHEPLEIKKKSRIFASHYADVVGNWVPDGWINEIIDVIKECEHDFIFITKNPERYSEFEWPENCILGVTIEKPEYWHRAEKMKGLKNRTLCSVEPIMGDFGGYDFSQFDEVVIGRMIFYNSKFDPRWVASIKHSNIYYQKNVRSYA